MITPEIPPLRTTGGLSDAVHGLARALVRAGHRVSVIVPSYTGTIERAIRDVHAKVHRPVTVDPLPSLSINLGEFSEEAWISTMDIPLSAETDEGSLRFYFVDNRENNLFGNRIKTYDYPDSAERFLFFNRVVAELYMQTQFVRARGKEHLAPPDVIHYHDWGTGHIGYYLRHVMQNLPKAPLIYNIHNLGYSRGLDMDTFYRLTGEISRYIYSSDGLEFYRNIDPHKSAIVFSDRIVAVSPTYAQEILTGSTPHPGNLYAGILAKYRDKVGGILNGLPDEYGVELFVQRRALPASFGKDDLAGKSVCRRKLQEVAGLTPDENAFVMVASGRWADQKGTDVMIEALPAILQEFGDIQFATIGSEASERENFRARLKALGVAFPGRVAVLDFDQVVSRHLSGENLEALVLAGGSAMFMPSRYEPCGLGQMKALLLGTPVIANRTGGLADTVKDGETGFLFDGVTAENILSRTVEAYALARTNPEKWKEMAVAAMERDFSWTAAARHYIELYEETIDFWARKSSLPPD